MDSFFFYEPQFREYACNFKTFLRGKIRNNASNRKMLQHKSNKRLKSKNYVTIKILKSNNQNLHKFTFLNTNKNEVNLHGSLVSGMYVAL